jgi:hypothetical protein
VFGSNARFVMEGGEISGNRSTNTAQGVNAVGGVAVSNGGRFTMSGGILNGNFRTTGNTAADLWVGSGTTVSITGGTLGERVNQ